MSFTIEPATSQTVSEAFQLMYADEAPSLKAQLVADSLALIESGDLCYEHILMLRSGKHVLGMIVWWINPGGGQLWPPRVRSSLDRIEHEDALISAAQSHLYQREARLIQCLLTEHEFPLSRSLMRHGFSQVTTLLSMTHDLQVVAASDSHGDWQFVSFSEDQKNRFQATIDRTYVDTLDFPELLGLRAADEVLEGHKYQGNFDPQYWLMAEHQGTPAAVLLVTEIPDWWEWELAYLGVVPEYRGQGVGKMLTAKAIQMTHAIGARRLNVSVDKRNEPARKLYEGAGFRTESEKWVLLKLRTQ